LFTGGGQEFALRAGTEPVIAIVGFGVAAETYDGSNLLSLKTSLWEGIKGCSNASLNGSLDNCIPILNVRFRGVEAGTLISELDKKGICISAGSACTSKKLEPSHVLRAMGLTKIACHQSVRISFGLDTTNEDLLSAATSIRQICRQLQK